MKLRTLSGQNRIHVSINDQVTPPRSECDHVGEIHDEDGYFDDV